MKKRFLLLALLIPVMVCCTNQGNENSGEGGEQTEQKEEKDYKEPVFNRYSGDPADEVLQELPPQINSGDVVQATRPYVEKFLTEVKYPDHDCNETRILDYEGGFNDPDAKEYGVSNADKPALYTIRWTADPSAGELELTLKDGGWSQKVKIEAGKDSQIISNLRPNASYTYEVKSTSGKVMTSGNFKTTGSLHQVFFEWNVRNARDLGGWKTYDGKTVKYRKIYRGGRLEGSTMSREGREAVLAEGIKAQLELRGSSDMLQYTALGKDYDFCNPCIDNGGTSMLSKYKDKTKECFEFVVKCVREDKPVYFHCSLGRDRTGTLAALLLGVLGVPEGDVSQEYELTYFAPRGWSIAYSETSKVFKNTRQREYKDVADFLWRRGRNGDGTFQRFDKCVENYLLEIGVEQKDIDDFRALMLE
ncbi:MAG: tyrosine-protein phosphatase [Bacteroidales bacterium]|nr:tyrosine-protein phosphatase [Bacteroidales bacterium]